MTNEDIKIIFYIGLLIGFGLGWFSAIVYMVRNNNNNDNNNNNHKIA